MLVPLMMLAVGGSPAEAFELKRNDAGDSLRWFNTVNYKINPTNTSGIDEGEAIKVVQAAIREWSSVDGVSLKFNYQGTTKVAEAVYTDNVNTVYFEDNWPSEWDAGFLALTYTWSVDDGEIVAFDMAINESYAWGTSGDASAHDLHNAMTHEIGHAVGLGHSTAADASMYPDSQMGDLSKRDLAQDDVAGLSYLYNGEVESEQWMCATGGAPTAPLLGFFAVAAAVAFRRRRQESEEGSMVEHHAH